MTNLEFSSCRQREDKGKSRIAEEYCRQSRSIYSAVFWVNASLQMMVVQSMERVAAETSKA
jgi:hypothetical protein